MKKTIFLSRIHCVGCAENLQDKINEVEGVTNRTLNVWADNESALRFYESIGLRKQKIGMELIL